MRGGSRKESGGFFLEILVLTDALSVLLGFNTFAAIAAIVHGYKSLGRLFTLYRRIPWSSVDLFFLYFSWAGLGVIWLVYYCFVGLKFCSC